MGFSNHERDLQGKKTVCSTLFPKLAANSPQHIFVKWVEHCKKMLCFPREIL
jgi:hypothetical protein